LYTLCLCQPNDPFYASWYEFSEEDEVLKGFDKVAIDLALRSDEITLVLFNDLNHAVFTTTLRIGVDHAAFEKWIYRTYNVPEYKEFQAPEIFGNFMPESQLKGFAIPIFNVDNSKTEKLNILSPEYADFLNIDQVFQGNLFNHSHYQEDGKHGTLQELGISSKLQNFFTLGVDFFVSPKDANDLEFADFLLFDKNAVLVIESKYVQSVKPTRKHAAIAKAIKQLERAEEAIMNGATNMKDAGLQDRLAKTDVVVKVCLLNDRLNLDERYRETLLSHFEKYQIPIFTSLVTFSDFLTALKLKNPEALSHNVMSNLITLYEKFMDGEREFPLLHRFSVEGLSIQDLNELGKSRVK